MSYIQPANMHPTTIKSIQPTRNELWDIHQKIEDSYNDIGNIIEDEIEPHEDDESNAWYDFSDGLEDVRALLGIALTKLSKALSSLDNQLDIYNDTLEASKQRHPAGSNQ